MTDSGVSHVVRRIGAAGGVFALALVAVLATVVSAASGVWNVHAVGGPVTTRGVVVAVVDTGVDASHPALGGRVLRQINIDGGAGDDNGHGTHVAGTAAGGTIDCGDGPAAIGMAPGATILPVRVLDRDGTGTVGGVAEGIRAAADRGAEVVNLSLGPTVGPGTVLTGNDSRTLTEAIEYAWSKGSIPVLAAGNENNNPFRILYPAGFGDIPAVVVTATGPDGTRAGYADTVGNARWGIAAPGGAGGNDPDDNVLSAWPDRQCAVLAGTSMAAPHVSGALAVLRSRGLGQRESVERILATARPTRSSGTGAGLLDLSAALSGTGTPPPNTEPPVTSAATTPPSTVAAATVPSNDAAPSEATPTTTSPGNSASSSTTTSTPSPAAPGPTTSPTALDAPDEWAADVTVDLEDGGGVGAPLAATAGLACAACWLALGRAALRR